MRTLETMLPEQAKLKAATVEELEARIRHLESQLSFQSSLLDHAYSAVIATDSEGIITHWNRFAEKLYQWRAGEVLGKNILDVLIPESELTQSRQIMNGLASDSGHWEGEFLVRRKDGSTFPAWVADSAIRNEKGAIAGFVGVSTDITERKRLEMQLREAHKFESLGILAGGIAHDFNNLLVGILGNTSIVQEVIGADDPMRPLLDDIVQAGERAAALVQQMLAYAGKTRYFLEPVDLSAKLREIAVEMRGAIPSNVEVRLELQENQAAIRADATQMRQIVTSLLHNAVEAIGKGPGLVTIHTGAESSSHIFLEVRDNGCGMDEATQASIFDPFFSTKFQGRGLGLAAVQGIVKAHKGTLTVQSAPGLGSTFRLVLPAAL